MKSLLFIVSAFIFFHHSVAQNVGIGTTSPQATLDIKGNQRLGGASHFMTYDSLGGKIEWKNSNLYVPVSQYLMQHSAAADGLFYNNTAPISGQLEYRNQFGNPVFFTNFLNGNGYFAGNLGIGTTAPLTKMHIYNGASGAIPFAFSPLVVENNGHSYINILSPAANEGAILFGQPGSSANGVLMYNNTSTPNGFQFRNNGNITRMVINNSGNVGMGLITPNARLSISTNGTELEGTATGNTFRTNAGTLGSSAGSEISLANIGYLSSNNSSLGIRAYRSSEGTDWTSTALLLGYDVDNTVRAGGGFLAISANGNIGIRTATPNAPLSFPPALGKKITLYPGTTGDVGMAVQGNLLQIYSDNPNADIALGYDQAGVFTERFRVKANGSLAVNGNSGGPGQVLQSNGGGAAPSWITPATTSTQYYRTKINPVVLTDASSRFDLDVPVSVLVNSIITVSVTVNISTGTVFGCNNGELSISIEPLYGGGLYDLAGVFSTPCGQNKYTISTGELPLLASNATPKVFGPGAGGVRLGFVKTSSAGPDLTIGNISPAVVIVKVVPL